MNNNSGIYCILNIINSKIYVGSTVDLKTREQTHFSHLRNKAHHNQYLQSAFNKYGENNFIFTVLEFVEDTTILIQKEQLYIQKFSPDVLYNINPNAASNLGIKHKNAHKNNCKVYQFSMDGVLIKEWKSIDDAATSLNIPWQNIRRMCEKTTMIVNNVEYLSKSAGGFAWSYDKNCVVPQYKNKKKVGQYTIDGIFIKEYESTTEAQKQLKFTHLHVSDVCKGKRKSSGGFIWKYVE